MVAEMTSQFSMIIPAMLATTLSYFVSGEMRIYESQVDKQAISPAHRSEYVIPLIQLVTVGDEMRTNVPEHQFQKQKRMMTSYDRRRFPVIEGERLVGVHRQRRGAGRADCRGSNVTQLITANPRDSLQDALSRMSRAHASRLPIVDTRNPNACP